MRLINADELRSLVEIKIIKIINQAKVKRKEALFEALMEAAKTLRDYCENHVGGCDGCAFNYDGGAKCRIGDYSIPEKWPLVVREKKDEED